MTKPTEGALDFAKAHIDAYYDSDFFPKRDEYVALWASWDDVKKHIANEKLVPDPPRAMPAPKATGGYRIVHQLEPLSAIIYTAFTHMVAREVEAARSDASTACSYRIALSDQGFFALGNGYGTFIERCRALASSHKFVLVADIADFYNRVYLHRLENSLAAAGAHLAGVAESIEKFITSLNVKASQGVPVGPAASIVLSEAALIDVDQFLATKGFPYVRYVDDFRIFSNSKHELESLLEDLVQHLFDAHRLQLAPAKTAVIACKKFAAQISQPEDHERAGLVDLAKIVCDYGDRYTESDLDELVTKYLNPRAKRAAPALSPALTSLFRRMEKHEEAERELVQAKLLRRLLSAGLRKTRMDLGLVRHALRLARRLGSVELVDEVLERIDRLEPALPDVFLYLWAVVDDAAIASHIRAFRSLLVGPTFDRSRFARHWASWLIATKKCLLDDPVLGSRFWKVATVEWRMRAARTTRNRAIVRDQKATLSGLGIWDRRAVLMAAEVLPADERDAWLRAVPRRDVVDGWIISWALKQP